MAPCWTGSGSCSRIQRTREKRPLDDDAVLAGMFNAHLAGFLLLEMGP
jgi:hypothetical protein